jgi:predicted phosphodiesterase
MMNNAFGYSYTESKYRKYWTIWNAGREYERSLKESGIASRILALSDFHVPYQLPIETFSEYAGKIDILVLNGDLVDHQPISRFSHSYRNSPMEEIIECRQYLIDLIEMIAPKEVYITVGNHEARFESYLSKNLDTDLTELMPSSALDLIVEDGLRRYDKRTKAKVWYDPLVKVFPEIKIHFNGDWKCKVGKTWFSHPFAFSSGNLKTAERAMEFFLKSDPEPFDSLVMAHTHRTGDLKKGRITIFEQGACCHTEKMNYTDGKLSDPQQKGFMFVAQDKDGNIVYDATKRIVL